MQMQFCRNCGLLLPSEASHCPKCGLDVPPLPPVAAAPQPQKQAAAPVYAGNAKEDTPHTLTTGSYFLTLVLFAIPFAGLIAAFVWSFSSGSAPARRNLARAYLLRKLMFAVFFALLAVVIAVVLYALFSNPFYSYSMMW